MALTPNTTIAAHTHVHQRRFRLPLSLSGSLVVLLVIASALGLFLPNLYRDTPDWVAQTRATDLVTLVGAVPVLIVALILAARGTQWAQVVWLGTLGYLIYMYMIYAFDVSFNPLFLVYVAVLSLSVWSLIALLMQIDPEAVHARCESALPVRTIAVFLGIVAVLFFLTWMKDIVPALLNDTRPTSLAKTQQATNPVEVLDLSFFLPLVALAGLWLWQRRPWGYVLAGMGLTTMTLIGLSIVADMVFERLIDPTVSLDLVPAFAVITLGTLALLIRYVGLLWP